MVNLLRNKKRENGKAGGVNSDKTFEKNAKQEDGPDVKAEHIGQQDKGVNIKRYKDPEGLSLFNLELGLWLIKHRQKFYKSTLVLLIAVSAVTWSIFLYSFGSYYIFGMRSDRRMISGLAGNQNNIHEIVLAQAAKPLRPHSLELIKTGDNRYDIHLKIDNPNERQWAEFNYYFSSGASMFGSGEDFILPGESKFIFSLANESVPNLNNVEFYIGGVDWGRISNKNFKDWENFKSDRLDFTISETKFTTANATNLTERINLSTLDFKITNNSTYNYWNVDLNILLYSRNKIMGVNIFQVDRLMSEEIRDISVTWPGRLGRVAEIKVEPALNITRDDIYIKHDSGPGEKK